MRLLQFQSAILRLIHLHLKVGYGNFSYENDPNTEQQLYFLKVLRQLKLKFDEAHRRDDVKAIVVHGKHSIKNVFSFLTIFFPSQGRMESFLEVLIYLLLLGFKKKVRTKVVVFRCQ